MSNVKIKLFFVYKSNSVNLDVVIKKRNKTYKQPLCQQHNCKNLTRVTLKICLYIKTEKIKPIGLLDCSCILLVTFNSATDFPSLHDLHAQAQFSTNWAQQVTESPRPYTIYYNLLCTEKIKIIFYVEMASVVAVTTTDKLNVQ